MEGMKDIEKEFKNIKEVEQGIQIARQRRRKDWWVINQTQHTDICISKVIMGGVPHV